MKKLFISSTLLFGIAVAGFWLAAALSPEPVGQTAVAAPTEKQYSLQDVAKHATPGDCWMSINGQVYDFTAYLPGHPADPAVIQPKQYYYPQEVSRELLEELLQKQMEGARQSAEYAKKLCEEYARES